MPVFSSEPETLQSFIEPRFVQAFCYIYSGYIAGKFLSPFCSPSCYGFYDSQCGAHKEQYNPDSKMHGALSQGRLPMRAHPQKP